MTDFKELREALDAVEASPEFVKGQWAIEPEMFEPDCLCDEDIAYIAAANPSTIRPLLAELDAARTTLAHIAAIAHEGGLAKLNEHGALCNIRRLSIPYWDCSGNQAEAVKRVDAAIDAAMKEQQ